MAAFPLGAAGISIAIATTEYHPPWKSAWFIAGVVVGVLGCGLALWSLVLYLAHNHVDQHAYPYRPPTPSRVRNCPTPSRPCPPRQRNLRPRVRYLPPPESRVERNALYGFARFSAR